MLRCSLDDYRYIQKEVRKKGCGVGNFLSVYTTVKKIQSLLKGAQPKCEIFIARIFHDFKTIKPFWVDDFGVGLKYKLIIVILEGATHHLVSDAYSQHTY
jgi:hypothetical protein